MRLEGGSWQEEARTEGEGGHPGEDAIAISRGFPWEAVGAEESHRLLALERALVARDTVWSSSETCPKCQQHPPQLLEAPPPAYVGEAERNPPPAREGSGPHPSPLGLV